MVNKSLTDFSRQRNTIVMAINNKIARGAYDQALHDCFKKSDINIRNIENIISSIETKLRKIEIVHYTFFDSEYDSSIIVNNSMPVIASSLTNKMIETEFDFGTNVLKNRIDINDPFLYNELINLNFQIFILTTASLYEVLVKFCETLLKKIDLYDGEDSPYKSIPFKRFIMNWDKLVDLGYRRNDDFYICISNHRVFLDKYLNQINSLRNRFIHGYNINLEINRNQNEYMVNNYDPKNFPTVARGAIISELVLNNFVNTVLTNTRSMTTDILDLFAIKLTRSGTKLPM